LRRTLSSALLYTLAFNLTFLLQELFLVLPKALTPGLHPTLYHNNHTWEGTNALAGLFQGTGVLATTLSGLLCLLGVRHAAPRPAMRLFLVWMAFSGLFMALPQIIVGALSAPSDVGMAMAYLDLGTRARAAAACAAVLAMALAAWSLAGAFLGCATQAAQLASARARAHFIFQVATLPALLAIPLIIPFRIPREPVEVAAVPAVVSILGALWVQAFAWRGGTGSAAGAAGAARAPIALPLAAAVSLLLVFQLLLRRGISF
jgi:hypothetical protein